MLPVGGAMALSEYWRVAIYVKGGTHELEHLPVYRYVLQGKLKDSTTFHCHCLQIKQTQFKDDTITSVGGVRKSMDPVKGKKWAEITHPNESG